nr:putative 27-kD protein [Citrus associated ampelovirus 1]
MYHLSATVVPSQSVTTYDVKFMNRSVKAVVTAEPGAVNKWLANSKYGKAKANEDMIYGIDAEWVTTNSGRSKVCVLQIANETGCLIYQIGNAEIIPRSLYKFFLHPNNIYAGVAVAEDFSKLYTDYNIVNNGMVVDLRDLAVSRMMSTKYKWYGLKRLTEDFCGYTLPKDKRVTLSNWAAFVLNAEQVTYATLDALASFENYVEIEYNAKLMREYAIPGDAHMCDDVCGIGICDNNEIAMRPH